MTKMATDPLFLLVAIFVASGHLRLNPEEYVSLYGNLMTIFVFIWASSAMWPSSKLATNTEDGHQNRQGWLAKFVVLLLVVGQAASRPAVPPPAAVSAAWFLRRKRCSSRGVREQPQSMTQFVSIVRIWGTSAVGAQLIIP
jgi:hypothetical protein